MTKDQALKMVQDACPYTNKELRGAFYEGFIKALDQLPDDTKMIEPIGEIVEAHGLIAVSIPEMPPVGTKLYAEPPKREWVGLTNEDIADVMQGSVEGINMLPYQFARTIEAKLKEKNTFVTNLYTSEKYVYKSDKIKHDETLEEFPNSTTDVVEPIAWIGEEVSGYRVLDWDKEDLQREYPFVYPLYTAPPKREWVWLTVEEVDSWELPDCPTVFEFAQFIETKLKENNNEPR